MSDFKYSADKTNDVVCMGRISVDLYAGQVNSPLKDVQSFNKYLGGSPANISVGTSRLGLNSALFSGVGTDDMGKFLKQELLKEKVDTSMLIEKDEHLTALVILGVQPPNTFPLIFYRENCADMQLKPQDLNIELLKDSKAFQFSGTGISTESMRETTKYALDVAKQNGVKVVLDIDYRPVLWGLTAAGDGETRFTESAEVSAIYKDFLPFCDLIVGTDEELCIAAGVSDPIEAIKMIQDLCDADIVYKTGLQGSEVHIKSQNNIISVPAFLVDVFNTLGAGDAYMSGLLAGLLRGKSWETSLAYANASGAIVCSRHACAPAIPTLAELEYFIDQYPKQGKQIVYDEKLARIHRLKTVGQAKDFPLTLLAYDHRWQFEEVCDQYNISYSKIVEYKSLVYEGFKKVRDDYKGKNTLGVICDPQYGLDVLQQATESGDFVLAPIEAANIDLIEWIESNKSAHETLASRPKEWGVKVLWKYSKFQDEATKKWQMTKLKELAQACNTLERKIMLELIIPKTHEICGKEIAAAIEDTYEAGVYPFWWKLEAVYTETEWHQIDKAILKYDENARIIVLGGPAKSLEEYKQDFEVISTSKLVNGFAFGRSIFWDVWLDYSIDKISASEAKETIAEKYTNVLEMWETVFK